MTYFQCLLQLLLKPAAGWEDVQASKPRPDWLMRHRLLPLMAACACLQCAQLIYHPSMALADAVLNALVAFVSLFGTLFIARTAFAYAAPWIEAGPRETMIVYAMGLMAWAIGLPPLLPAPMGLNYFLPVMVGVIVTRAVPMLKVSHDHLTALMVLIFSAIALPPILIQALFDWVLAAG